MDLPKPPFDPIKACFYLIALIITAQVVVALMGAAACLMYVNDIISGRWQCDKDGRLDGLLSSALSAALAFAGGFTRNQPPPPPPPPPPRA